MRPPPHPPAEASLSDVCLPVDTSVDVWACGCVLAELLAWRPLFPGETDIDQLQRVLALRGTPDVWLDDWPEVASLPDYEKISFTPMRPVGR